MPTPLHPLGMSDGFTNACSECMHEPHFDGCKTGVIERMSRMLLRLQWPAEDEGGNERCFICDRGPFKRPDIKKPKEPDGHAPDCELAAVLRAAGVLP